MAYAGALIVGVSITFLVLPLGPVLAALGLVLTVDRLRRLSVVIDPDGLTVRRRLWHRNVQVAFEEIKRGAVVDLSVRQLGGPIVARRLRHGSRRARGPLGRFAVLEVLEDGPALVVERADGRLPFVSTSDAPDAAARLAGDGPR